MCAAVRARSLKGPTDKRYPCKPSHPRSRRQWLHYGNKGHVAPYFKQPAYGGDAVTDMVKRFGSLKAAGQEPQY